MADLKIKLDAFASALSDLEDAIKNTDSCVPWDILETIDAMIEEFNNAGETHNAQLYENMRHMVLADPDLIYRGDDDSYDGDVYEEDDEEYDDED